jgi:hypothetical protein
MIASNSRVRLDKSEGSVKDIVILGSAAAPLALPERLRTKTLEISRGIIPGGRSFLRMALIVFLRGVNVGGHRTFRPSIVARELSDPRRGCTKYQTTGPLPQPRTKTTARGKQLVV